VRKRGRRPGVAAGAILVSAALAGCGLNVQSPDLFLLTRTGQGSKLTLVVNDSGTIRCNGAKAKPIPDALLIGARDLADNLATDAGKGLSLPTRSGSVFSYRISVQQGTIAFSDRDTGGHKELAEAELFAAQAAQQACGLSG
jgi:hypothetical protein